MTRPERRPSAPENAPGGEPEPAARAFAAPDLRPVRLTAPLATAGLIGGLALASGIALTATSGWLIVRASERPIILSLLVAIVGVRAFGMARPVLRYWERLRTHDAALADLAGQRVRTYAALIPLTPARLGRRGRADLLTAVVDDLDDVVAAQIRVTVPGLSALVAWGLTVAVVAFFDVRVALVLTALGLVVTAVSVAAYRMERRGTVELGDARAAVGRVAATLTTQADGIAAIGAGPAMLAELDAAQRTWRRLVARQARGRAFAAGAILVVVGWAVLTVGLMLDDAGHTAPVAALLMLTPVAVADALTPLADAARALARADGSSRRLASILDQQPAVTTATRRGPALTRTGPEPAVAGPTDSNSPVGTPADSGSAAADAAGTRQAAPVPHILLDAVAARWDADRDRALVPVTLDLPPGGRLAITGPNGSGKSTLLAVLARHLGPESGRYLLDGADALTAPLIEARGRFAIVDDDPHIFASTLRENLRLAIPRALAAGPPPDRSVDDGRLVAALTTAGLADWYGALPEALDTRLGAGGRGVSGGERARLALARAVLSRRPVVLLDEPVAHLDSPTAAAVLGDVFAACAGRTVVLVSHRADGIGHCDRVSTLPASDCAQPEPSATAL